MIIELLEVTYFSNLARLPSIPKNVPWSVSVPTCMVTCVVTCMVLVEEVFKHNQCAKISCSSDDAENYCQPVWRI